MLETELKALITKETFDKVKNHYTWDSAKNQENYYYLDTNNILSSNRTVFRIRNKDNKYKIQVKTHKNNNSPLQICEENEFIIDDIPEFISEEDALKYTGLKTGILKQLGYNTTLRYSYMWNKNVEICLDKTTYFDEVDYEIEVEYVDECPQQLLDELKALGIEFKEKTVGKYTRFIKKYLSLQTDNKLS